MSISVGIYDLFAYTIPGLLYIYVIYDLLQKLGLIKFSLTNPPPLPDGYGLIGFLLFVVSAHLLGHLLDKPARWFVFRLFRPNQFSESTLQRTKDMHSDLEIKFQPKDWGVLFSMLRMRNQEHARIIDTFEANSIMFRNVSFGFLILGCLQVYSVFLGFNTTKIAIAIALFIFSLIARSRSHMFHKWFIIDIYESSLKYGNTLKEVIAYDQGNYKSLSTDTKKRPARK